MKRSKRPAWTNPTNLIDAVGEKARLFLRVQEARIAFGNQVGALIRDQIPEEYTHGLQQDHASVEGHEDDLKREIVKQVMDIGFARYTLPRHKGIGAPGLAQIWGAFGNLDRYGKPSSLWKMAGLHVVNGRAPRRQRGVRWAKHDLRSFSPRAKTTILYRVADPAIRSASPYQKLYKETRAAILKRPRLGPSDCPFREEEHRTREGKIVPCIRKVKGVETSGHVHAHCLRIVAKRILLDLWIDWQAYKQRHGDEPKSGLKTNAPVRHRQMVESGEPRVEMKPDAHLRHRSRPPKRKPVARRRRNPCRGRR